MLSVKAILIIIHQNIHSDPSPPLYCFSGGNTESGCIHDLVKVESGCVHVLMKVEGVCVYIFVEVVGVSIFHPPC